MAIESLAAQVMVAASCPARRPWVELLHWQGALEPLLMLFSAAPSAVWEIVLGALQLSSGVCMQPISNSQATRARWRWRDVRWSAWMRWTTRWSRSVWECCVRAR